MDKQPLKIAGIIGVIILAVVGLAMSMKAVSQSEEYTPSPGGQNASGHMADGPNSQGSAPNMPGGPPSGRVPGSAH